MGNNAGIEQGLKERYKTSENLSIRGNLHNCNINNKEVIT